MQIPRQMLHDERTLWCPLQNMVVSKPILSIRIPYYTVDTRALAEM